MKRFVIGSGIVGLAFAATFGLAASLNVSSGTLGAGTSAVAACQSGTIDVTYAPQYSASIPGYEATTVTLNGLDTTASACGGKAYKLTLTNGSTSLGEYTGTVPSSGTTATMTASGVSASSVTGVHLTIYG